MATSVTRNLTAKETDHGSVCWRWPGTPDWHHGFEVALAGSDRLRAPKSVWGCTYAPLKLNDLRLVHWGEFMGSFACSGWAEAQVLGMSEGNLTPTPVRFSAEFIARVDAIAKSMALSHSTVLRLAVNQWFEAGGDKSLLSASSKKSAKKAGKTRRNGDMAY